MQSLYQISDELLSIFNEIESNDGEVNEEQLQALEIAQENLQEKLSSYKKAIRCWEADIDACKQEEKRIKATRQVKENRIDNLKDRMLGAVLQFGYEGKPNKKGKTNHFYELPDGRIFTKTTESTEINENRINILINLLIEICEDNIRVFPYENEEFYEFILNKLNEKLHLYYEGQEDFTIDDLKLLVFNYSIEINLKDLIYKYADNIKDDKEMGIPFLGLSFVTPKSILKLALDAGNELTIAKIKETQSITIK
jgi:hypothetical protein